MLSHLDFRRQFILGPRYVEKYDNYIKIPINEKLFLTVHPDLKVCQANKDNKKITLLGDIVDPFIPRKSNIDILSELLQKTSSFPDIINLTYKFCGRWIIIYCDNDEIKLLHDPCGLRQVFYTCNSDIIWCGSQPEIIKDNTYVEVDKSDDIINFINSKLFTMQLKFWPGEGTLYKNIKHLLPNHYLDIKLGKSIRYWPNPDCPREEKSLKEVVEISSNILKGTVEAISYRYRLSLALTSGYDSRTVLAACKNIIDNVFVYIYQHKNMNEKHADIKIPLRILNKCNKKLNILFDKELPAENDFGQSYFKSVTLARDNYFINMNFDKYNSITNRLNLDTIGSEIGKGKFRFCDKVVTSDALVKLINYSGIKYAINAYDHWLKDSESTIEKAGYNILDIFYWEQDVGNVCALAYAENDIALEDFSPFNNRYLLTLFLSVNEKYRIHPHVLHREIIKNLWEDLLHEPFNPLSTKAKIRKFVIEQLRKMKILYLIKKIFFLKYYR